MSRNISKLLIVAVLLGSMSIGISSCNRGGTTGGGAGMQQQGDQSGAGNMQQQGQSGASTQQQSRSCPVNQ